MSSMENNLTHHFDIKNCDVPLPEVVFPSPRIKKGADPRRKNTGARANSGRKSLVKQFNDVIPAVQELVEKNGFAAHARRRQDTGVSCGTTIPQVRDHILKEVKGLENIGLTTVRYMFKAQQPNHKNAKNYRGVIDARVAPKSNNMRANNHANHFYAARVRYRMEFMTQFWRKSVALSSDTMNKICIGTLAVSRYHQLRNYFPVNDTPEFWDHDFPIGHGYKITPVGYMFLQPQKPEQLTRDERNRYHFEFPRTGPLHMFNRVQKQYPLNIQCHVNDLYHVLNEEVSKGKTMVTLVTDSGPDWNVKSWTVAVFLLRLFKELNLDFLCCTSYAPGQSAFNPIEHAWSPLSRKLSGVTFPASVEGETEPPCHQRGLSDEERSAKENVVFTQAIESLNNFWNGMTYNGYQVKSEGANRVQKFDGYEFVHDLLSKATPSKIKNHPEILEELIFISTHGDRQPGEFSLRKCKLCSYCAANPIKATAAMNLLDAIGGLPCPFPQEGTDDTFASYMDAIEVPRVNPTACLPVTKNSFLGSCPKCNSYTYCSRVDKLKHIAIVHELPKRQKLKKSKGQPSKIPRKR